MSSNWDRGKHKDRSSHKRLKWLSVSRMEIKHEVPVKRHRRNEYSFEGDSSHDLCRHGSCVRYKMIGDDMKKDLLEEY